MNRIIRCTKYAAYGAGIFFGIGSAILGLLVGSISLSEWIVDAMGWPTLLKPVAFTACWVTSLGGLLGAAYCKATEE